MIAFLALPASARAEVPDDPGIARRLAEPTATITAPAPAPGDEMPWRFSGLFGWASPVVDPDVREGFGAAVVMAYGATVAAELRSSFGYSHYEPPLDNVGLPFASGDITLGANLPLLDRRNVRVDVFFGGGPAWMQGFLGKTWSLGLVGGMGAEFYPWAHFGLRVDLAYHLFHLTEIGGPKFYDRNSFREVGPVDRFDLFIGPAVRL